MISQVTPPPGLYSQVTGNQHSKLKLNSVWQANGNRMRYTTFRSLFESQHTTVYALSGPVSLNLIVTTELQILEGKSEFCKAPSLQEQVILTTENSYMCFAGGTATKHVFPCPAISDCSWHQILTDCCLIWWVATVMALEIQQRQEDLTTA